MSVGFLWLAFLAVPSPFVQLPLAQDQHLGDGAVACERCDEVYEKWDVELHQPKWALLFLCLLSKPCLHVQLLPWFLLAL
mmetsp:Transcript_4321/g.9126  ORF Transcript_4321/g.9126 Transcript_4321/m.9126 type:complete len:80 (-) Transcript_4321:998-1237(-)